MYNITGRYCQYCHEYAWECDHKLEIFGDPRFVYTSLKKWKEQEQDKKITNLAGAINNYACLVCSENQVIISQSCGHSILCISCALNWFCSHATCPKCRKTVIYVSLIKYG